MGSLFRSEEMCLTQLYLQSEAAYSCISELGELGLVQFRDLNPDVNAFQRKFVNEVRRCDEMERKLRFLERELIKDNIPVEDTGENPEAPLPREMIELEATFEKLENEMKEVNTNQEAIQRSYLELKELMHILHQTQHFFEEVDGLSVPVIDEEGAEHPSMNLGFITGVIPRSKVHGFERVLWRACRGNVFMRYADIDESLEDPFTGEKISKCAFIVFFQGDRLKGRVRKICEGLRAVIYPCPERAAERLSTYALISDRIADMTAVLSQTDEHRKRVLTQVASSIRVWFIKVRKIKAIYHTLNMFNMNIAQKCLIAECWCPVDDLDKIQIALRRGTDASGSAVPSILHRMTTKLDPPTYNKNTELSSAFQGMVDAYGVANYREVNPGICFNFILLPVESIDFVNGAGIRKLGEALNTIAPFTIITFPFLFAVMFGDLGHGILFFLFGLWMVVFEKRLEKFSDSEFWEMIYGGRYIVFLMGAFSIYTGLLYNECFSLSFNIFGSAWNVSAMHYSDSLLHDKTLKHLTLDPAVPGVMRGSGGNYPNVTSYPYQYGMDPIWQLAENKITFLNSFKMKGSVIIGITHMLFGIFLSLMNYIHFKQYLNIWTTFIPRVLFIMAIFGYLVFMIIYKWAAWSADKSKYAPSLLIGLINMFMFKTPALSQHTLLYNGQGTVQMALVFIAAICIPWMLLIKPCIIHRRHKQNLERRRARLVVSDEEDAPIIRNEHTSYGSVNDGAEVEDAEEEEPFDMTEIMIHQMIETIEYCLSCISHTASYLRLWALSLAHSELSEVLWTMVMHNGLHFSGFVGAAADFLVFWAFSVLTVAILLAMEGLSAFLHALRLHWVEFQDKFYTGEGYSFEPFSFNAIIEGRIEDD